MDKALRRSGTWARDDATGALPEAREYWQRALAMFEELGVPEADEVRALLT